MATTLPGVFGFGLPAGQSYLLGTITFHKDNPAGDDFAIRAVLGIGDSIAGLGPNSNIMTICNHSDFSDCNLGFATLKNSAALTAPEPASTLLFAVGGIVVVAATRRRRSQS